MCRPEDLFFARPIVHYPDGLLPTLGNGSIAMAPDDGDTGLADWLAGHRSFPEAYATAAARDASLGFANRYVEFIPSSWAEAEAGGYSPASIAVGPSLGDAGFEEISALVIDFNIEELVLFGSGTLIVGRRSICVEMGASGPVMLGTFPIYTSETDDTAFETADWLVDAIARAFKRRRATVARSEV